MLRPNRTTANVMLEHTHDDKGSPKVGLTPEEDSIGDPEDIDDEIDDLLPADLWFVTSTRRNPTQS